MKNLSRGVRQVTGFALLVSLALLFFMLFRLTIPKAPMPGAYPPPGETPTPTPTATPTATGQPYPPPGGKSAPEPTWTPTPTPIPTATPWKLSDLPALKTYPTPAPFREMRILYADHAKLGYFVTDLMNKEILQWPVWPEDQRGGSPSQMLRVSPDGSQILYSLWFTGPGFDLGDLKRDSIWVMNPDGSGKRKLVGASEDWYPVDAIWSPDGTQIAYLGASQDPVSLMLASRELWVMNADGSEPRLVLSNDKLLDLFFEAPALFFRWMENGYIYFASESLFAVNPQDGSLYRLMDNVDAIDLIYNLSPDGQKAWPSTDVPMESLTLAGFQIVDLPVYYSAVWSQDGSRLAYVAADASGTWLRDLASGKERQLLPYTPGEDVRLRAFSPNNRYIAYQTDAGLFVVDLESEHLEPTLVLADPHEPISGYWALDFLAWIPVP